MASSEQEINDVKEEKAKYPQTTQTVLMVPPNKYTGWNAEAAKDNKFMVQPDVNLNLAQYEREFYRLVDALTGCNVDVIVASKGTQKTPDCIFPNNWLSIHDGTPCIYPMRVENRRLEIRADIIQLLVSKGLASNDLYDLTPYVEENLFLEGTGALVLDRGNRIAYCNMSLRAMSQLAIQWAHHFGYKLVLFQAFDDEGSAIYHTNVLMSVGTTYAIVCFDAIKGKHTKKYVASTLRQESRKEIIEISIAQMKQFCGNVLELKSKNGGKILAMSDKAYKAFTQNQIQILQEKHALKIIHPDIDNIENLFGGGVRCMIAEVF